MNYPIGQQILPEPNETATEASLLPRLAFVHIPKTAGTSVTNALISAYGTQTFPAMTTLDYVCYDDAQLLPYRLYKGHAYRRDYERLPADTIRFTVLRDPVARALSYFNYYRHLDVAHIDDPFVLEACRLAKTNSIVEFIYSESPFLIEHLRLGQVRQFLPPETLAQIAHRQFLTRELRQRVLRDFVAETDRFAFVLTYESLRLSFPLMAARLGLPPSCRRLPRDNVSPPSEAVDESDIRRALIDVNAPEFACYEHVRRREQDWLAVKLEALVSEGRMTAR